MPRTGRERIEDILDGIEAVEEFVAGLTLEAFLADWKTIRAVTYEILIIGEAVRHLPEALRAQHPEVPWTKMQAVRNIAVHEYFRVDPGILWQIATRNLPPLVAPLRRILTGEATQPVAREPQE